MTEETEALRFNTGIAAMMEFVNGAFKWGGLPPRAVLEPFVLLLAPYAPHLAEEMWQASLGPLIWCKVYFAHSQERAYVLAFICKRSMGRLHVSLQVGSLTEGWRTTIVLLSLLFYVSAGAVR